MTAAGHAIIVIGDTLDECLGLSSNVIVFRDGLISGFFDCPVDFKPSQQEVVQFYDVGGQKRNEAEKFSLSNLSQYMVVISIVLVFFNIYNFKSYLY